MQARYLFLNIPSDLSAPPEVRKNRTYIDPLGQMCSILGYSSFSTSVTGDNPVLPSFKGPSGQLVYLQI